MALAKPHSRERKKWSKNTRELEDLNIGDHVYLQNLMGNNPLRWERTGVVVEIKPFHQYTIKIDGPGRVTLRDRKYLRKFTPFQPEKIFMPVSVPVHTAVAKPCENTYNELAQSEIPEPNSERMIQDPSRPLLCRRRHSIKPQKRPHH